MRTYFFDTYAFFEILKGNPFYDNYRIGVGTITTKLNLMEFHHQLLTLRGEGFADLYYDKYEKFAVPFDSETIKNASKFRARHKKLNMSYIDCLGYAIAKSRNIPFLTGDKAFANLENVEFVK